MNLDKSSNVGLLSIFFEKKRGKNWEKYSLGTVLLLDSKLEWKGVYVKWIIVQFRNTLRIYL